MSFNAGWTHWRDDRQLPRSQEEKCALAATQYRQRELGGAHFVGYSSVSQLHDQTFDNPVTGEASREFAFERASFSIVAASIEAVIAEGNETPNEWALNTHQAVANTANNDTPQVFQSDPGDVREMLATTVVTLFGQLA
ncbi:MAG: hypothetical protein GY788_17640 [bacterium]|nr:hypothetical protein [bacterium]